MMAGLLCAECVLPCVMLRPLSSLPPLRLEVRPRPNLSLAESQAIDVLCARAYETDLSRQLARWPTAVHVLGYVADQLVSHALWLTRHVQAGDGPLWPTAYVEAVATEPALQGRGYASAVLRHLAAALPAEAYVLAALSPSDSAFYARLGWELWRGPLGVRTEHGVQAMPADEQAMVLRLPNTPPLDLDAPLSIEWRVGAAW